MNKKFSGKETAAYGIGAIGKDMVYALSASYVMYYYNDILGLSAGFVGLILMIARVFDAFNDPLMGVVVAKTHSRFGRFRPWIISGTVLNAVVLYALFNAPFDRTNPDNMNTGLMIFFAVLYIVWGMTYTMMDIPYWSMIPAVTETSKERESLSVVGRTCAGVGNALITVFTVMAVSMLGGGNEKAGFGRFALIIAIVFVVTELILFVTCKEKPIEKESVKTASVGEMFKALFKNDQAVVTVIAIVLINSALYITSNLIIYFFKYDIGAAVGSGWTGSYTMFTAVGGAAQILGMMIVYPLLRKKLSNTAIFKLCLTLSISGYALLLLLCLIGQSQNVAILFIPGIMVFAANGMLTVLTTVFLSNTVDYGEIKTGQREESVIFSMQTFVVKAASGFAVFLSGIGLDLIHLAGDNSTEGEIVAQSASTLTGLHLLMTVLPMIGLIVAFIVFVKKFKLTDERADEIAKELKAKHAAEEQA